MRPAHQVFLKQMVSLLIAAAAILLNCLLAYPNPCPPKRCVLPLLMLVCISLKKILDISELGPENEQCFIPYMSSCYFVACVLKIEKQRRIERIKQKRAQLQELLLQVKVPGCLSLPPLPVPAPPLTCLFPTSGASEGVSGTTGGQPPTGQPAAIPWSVSKLVPSLTSFRAPQPSPALWVAFYTTVSFDTYLYSEQKLLGVCVCFSPNVEY